MALIKQTVTPKGISFDYFKIKNICPYFESDNPRVEVVLSCYVNKDYREANEVDNIIDNYVCILPYINEDFSRETIYKRIKAEMEEFKDSTDDI